MSRIRHLIGVALLTAAVSGSAFAQGQPVERPAPKTVQASPWDTQVLVNEAHNLTRAQIEQLTFDANSGNTRAMVLVGLAYEMGAAEMTPDPATALRWFLRAADRDVAWAQMWVGDFYFSGSPGVPRDLFKAMELYEKAANKGEPRAAFFLGQMYFFGEGVAVNHAEAAKWFRKATPADPDTLPQLAALSESRCDTSFCVTLRQVIGAIMTKSAGRFTGEWDDQVHEWESSKVLGDSERCGFTSDDKTESGNPRNFFCDSEVITDVARGTALQKALADDVAEALPEFPRREDLARSNGPATFFERPGFPHIRVSYNETPGDAPQRVTLLIGP